MIVEIITDDNGKAIGWSMSGENREELNKLCDIRNLQFFGFDDTAIKYNGRKGGDDKTGNPGTVGCMSSSRTLNLIKSRKFNINNCNSLKCLTAIAYTLC